jgi:hypothetical protein
MSVVDVVDDAVVSDAAALSRTRVFSEDFYRPHYSIVNRLGQAGYGLAGLSFDDDLIAHRAA